jgi:hypothetical protein
MAEKVNTTLLGAAAEHFVMSQLLRQNMIAALAPAGVPDADIIVSNRVGDKLAAIQVKARRKLGSDGGWHMGQKHEAIVQDSLFYCFVEFGEPAEITRCWIVPSSVVAEAVKIYHAEWLAKPGKKGQPHNDSKMRRFLPDYKYETMPHHKAGWLDAYEEAWHLISNSSG